MNKLFCSVGDIVEFIVAITTTPWPGEEPTEVKVGSKYEIIDLVGEGWDLKRLSGDGPIELRILNSDMDRYVTIAKKE